MNYPHLAATLPQKGGRQKGVGNKWPKTSKNWPKGDGKKWPKTSKKWPKGEKVTYPLLPPPFCATLIFGYYRFRLIIVLWVFLVCLSKFVPQLVWNKLCRKHCGQNLSDCDHTAHTGSKIPQEIHDFHWKNCLNPKKTLGKALTDSLKTLTSLNKEVRLFWSLPSVSSLSDYSIWSSWKLFYPCDHSIWSIWAHCPQILLSLKKKGNEGV